jgi:D-3-phosphoglycerate dehydrogenase
MINTSASILEVAMSHPRKIVYPDAEESIAELFTGERLARLERLGEFTAYYGDPPSTEGFIERIGNANAIISGWGLHNDVLQAVKELEVVSFVGLGASTFFDLDEATRQGITVTHTTSVAGTIAEHTMALMLAATRHIARLDRDTRNGRWNVELLGFDLRGKTLGLIGFGRIAEAVVPLAKAFGMHVIAWTRNPSDERAVRNGIEFCDLDDLLMKSDILSLHPLLTPETEGLITSERLHKTKPGVVVVNTARAQILDEPAFLKLLTSGHIAAAGVDVFMEEPLPPGHPYTKLDNVVLTPHVASNTLEANAAIFDMTIDNLEAFFAGKAQNVATPPSP